MLITQTTYGNMRMNVSQLFHEIVSINLGCHYNREKQEIKEVSAKSMKYLMKSLANEQLKKESITNIPNDNTQTEKHVEEETNENKPPEVKENEIHNFIPYPDHNYGQQPPQTPPKENMKTKPSEKDDTLTTDKTSTKEVTKRITSTKQTEEFEGVTTCICGYSHDDGFMISCDNCSSWQHIECMGIKSSKVPESYLCHTCFPRELDVEKAKLIQLKKKENMSDGEDEDDDDGNEETEEASEDENSKQPLYTAISNTPTRITLFTSNQTANPPEKPKNRRSNRVQKRKSSKITEQKNVKRKPRKKDKTDHTMEGVDTINCFVDVNSLQAFINEHCVYEEAEENKYEGEFKNMHFNLPETVPAIDFKKAIQCHTINEVSTNRKGVVASCDIPNENFIWEFKGVVLPLKKFQELNPIFPKASPYVIYYNKIEHLPIVVDARTYGNDMRYLRHSCSPNSDFQHIALNGILRIVVVSKKDIEQGKEITVPFPYPYTLYKGFVECACSNESCPMKSIANDIFSTKNVQSVADCNNKLSPSNEAKVENDGIMLSESNPASRLDSEHALESECESLPGSDDAKNEKLSREERKLQAYLKQFEKLEKKQEGGGKKVKEVKTPVATRGSTEEIQPNITPTTSIAKTPVNKKTAVAKRKMSMSSKRRTRQSSCSSEPVSPVDQESNHSNASTPITPVAGNVVDAIQFMKNKHKKEKEPITLTLPIQRKLKTDHQANLLTPTPPSTPGGVNHLSPVKLTSSTSSSTSVSLSLSVDTSSHSHALSSVDMATAQLKHGFNGLLQIAHNRHLLSPATSPCDTMSSSGTSTSEERIGDATFRQHSIYPAFATSTWKHNFGLNQQPKYFGSMKKYWLKKYNNKSVSSSVSEGERSTSQLTIAGSLSSCGLSSSSTSYQRQMVNSTTSEQAVFKKPKNCVPLKRRFLMSYAKSNNMDTTIKYAKSNNKIDTTIKSTNDFTENKKRTDVESSNIVKIEEKVSENRIPISEGDNPSDIKSQLSNQSENLENKNSKEDEKTLNTQISDASKTVPSDQISLKRPSDTTPIVDDAKRPKISPTTNTDNINETKIITEAVPSLKDNQPIQVTSNFTSTENADSTKSSSVNSTSVSTCSVSSLLSPVLPVATVSTFPSKLLILNAESRNTTPQASPRSSIDSNPDSETGTLSSGEQVIVKKKLSFKEYRSRQRSQKSTSSNSSCSDEKPSQLCGNPTSASTDSLKLVIDSAVEKSSAEESRSNKYSASYVSNLPSNITEKYSINETKVNKPQNTAKAIERTSSSSSDALHYEPVSPTDDGSLDDSSHFDDTNRTRHSTIHTEITKNPFTIHNDITKNPFGRKTQGLLQYLSAQKYPHLLSAGNNTTGLPPNQYLPHEQRNGDIGRVEDPRTSSTHVNQASYSNTLDKLPNDFHGQRHYNRENFQPHARDYYQSYHGYGTSVSTNYGNFTESSNSTTQYGMPQQHRQNPPSGFNSQQPNIGSNSFPRQQHRKDRYLPY